MNRILLVGGGGREDAIARQIVNSGSSLFSVLKNRNPSIIGMSDRYLIWNELDDSKILEFALSNSVDLAFIGPDPVLDTQLVDSLSSKGIKVASPSRSAARIETSKAYMRELLSRNRIAGNIFSEVFDDHEKLASFIRNDEREYAVKPIGLTGGKGVKVMGEHLKTREEAIAYSSELIRKDGRVLLEERITGEEFSLQVFTDGTRIAPTPLAQDFKRAYEMDQGPNTGGMGSITDKDGLLPFVPKSSFEKAMRILQSIVDAMKKEQNPFRGVMYGQFMETRGGTKVVEINARFADPESLNVLSLFRGNFTDLLFSIAEGSLRMNYEFEKKATVLKYIVPKGYGTTPAPGKLLVNTKAFNGNPLLYYAAVSGTIDEVEMGSSRALAVVGIADSIPEASDVVERSLHNISGDYYIRHDIGTREMMERKMQKIRKL